MWLERVLCNRSRCSKRSRHRDQGAAPVTTTGESPCAAGRPRAAKTKQNKHAAWERMDPCICTAESLCCSPETINTVNQLYLNTKLKKKIKRSNVIKFKNYPPSGNIEIMALKVRGYLFHDCFLCILICLSVYLPTPTSSSLETAQCLKSCIRSLLLSTLALVSLGLPAPRPADNSVAYWHTQFTAPDHSSS